MEETQSICLALLEKQTTNLSVPLSLPCMQLATLEATCRRCRHVMEELSLILGSPSEQEPAEGAS